MTPISVLPFLEGYWEGKKKIHPCAYKSPSR